MKYIAAPDLHADPSTMDQFRTCIQAIQKTAREKAVDFIAFPGDLHNKNFYLSAWYNEFRALIKGLIDERPVVAIVGTPGHETEEMYGPLEDLGLVLLRPGKVYGLYGHGVQEIHGSYKPDAILFGIPELTKASIQARFSMSAETANAKAEDLFRRYVLEYMAPTRAMLPDVPAVALLHGTVIEGERDNERDERKKASAIIVKTEDLEPANIDRWELGHIHTPWSAETLCAGYAGSFGQTWAELGFVPSMNLVTVEPFAVTVNRVPYGLPERRKILHPLSVYDPQIAYWLHTKDLSATCPEGHPLNRITYEEQKTVVRRVSKEEAVSASLRKLFTLADPAVDTATLDLVDTLDDSATSAAREARDVSVESIEISGCTFWQGRTIAFRPATLETGLTQVCGSNGEGKSALLAFCTPYPCLVGKTPESGRESAIKDFFTEPESMIKKTILLNGQRHEHLITIKGAHTKSPKCECYLTINGMPQLERSTFDEMMAKCEAMYGRFSDYLLTSFYVQPQQGYAKEGALMSATKTDIRDLVLSISGIDREAQKRVALDHVSATERLIADDSAWLSGAAAFTFDLEAAEHALQVKLQELTVKQGVLDALVINGKTQRAQTEAAREALAKSNAEAIRRDADKRLIEKTSAEIKALEVEIERLKRNSKDRPIIVKQIADEEARRLRMDARAQIVNQNEKAQNDYDRADHEYNNKLSVIQLAAQRVNIENDRKYSLSMSTYNCTKARLDSYIENATKPCEHCGKIPYVAAEQMIKNATAELAALVKPVKPEPADVPSVVPGMPIPKPPVLCAVPPLEPAACQIDALRSQLEAIQKADATITACGGQIQTLEQQIVELRAREYEIDDATSSRLADEVKALEYLQTEYTALKAEAAALTATIDSDRVTFIKAKANSYKIAEVTERVTKSEALRDRWKYIATMLRADKIPAMELEIILDRIDGSATRNIAPFHDERYSFSTVTQKQGKKDIVDDFDIMIHDNMTGADKSFLRFSPGQKAFFSDAYVKALIEVRNERSKIVYSPIISDEADGPVQPEMVAPYYAMQDNYYKVKVLVVSHAPDAGNYIRNQIRVKELIV